MQKEFKKLKTLKKITACMHLRKLIEANGRNNLANLHLLYTVNRENFKMLLYEKYNPKVATCMDNIVASIIYLVTNQKEFLKNTIEHFSNNYELDFHSLHVAIYALNLAKHLKFEQEELEYIALAALFIDIGLKAVDEDIKEISMSLDDKQFKNIKKHPLYSVQIAEHNHIHNPYIIDAIKHHHERYDGSGYPDGLKKRNISKFAAILAICDTFDALTCDRPYRERLSYFEALNFMLKDETMRGKFDEKYLGVFLKSLL